MGPGRLPPPEPLHGWWQAPDRPRPWVTLSYAQSLDASLTRTRGRPTALSGPETLRLTHHLRASHQALLVGIDTVLADDPQLTVRLVEGPHPQPLVLDSRLRLPLHARVLQHPLGVWVLTTPQGARQPHRAALEARGARVLVLPADDRGRVDLRALVERLPTWGIETVMVEGGARVLTAFLNLGLAHAVVVTVVARYLGGLRVPEDPFPQPITLQEPYWQPLGQDVVLWARVK